MEGNRIKISYRTEAQIDKRTPNIVGASGEFIEFKHVMEDMPNPILITTAKGHIIYVNPPWEHLTGYSLEEVEGKNPNILKSNKTPSIVFKNMWKKLSKGESFRTEEVIDRSKDGTEYQISTTIFPIKHESKILFYVQIEEDITNRKKLEDLKKEFLSMATHELKTPMTTLKLMIQSQLRKLEKKPRNFKPHELQLIDRELNRLTHIIDDLSDVNRVESGKLHMDMKIINIMPLITDVVHQMRTISKGHKLKFKKVLPIHVVADENRIKQVLINLIKNAFKYSYPESEVIIRVKQQGTHCIVSVENKGAGIPRNQHLLIFDRFYQLHTGGNSGLGLGLYISKKIVEQHKGKLWLKSEKSKITTFYFSLQMEESERGHEKK